MTKTCARYRSRWMPAFAGMTCFLMLLVMVMPAQAASPAAAFFPLLPFDAAPDVQPSLMPVASNYVLEDVHPGVTRGIVVIHDFSRDAGKALVTVTALAGAENSKTIILAPQFLLDSDIQRFADNLPEKGRSFARWPLDRWVTGDDSIPVPPQKSISSFTALDLMLMYLGDSERFPDMKEVIVAGHGEGGDFVQRYAAVGQAPDVLVKDKIAVRFVVANPASYLYLTTVRPQKGRQGFTPPDEKLCKDYNTWPYGVDGLNAYARHAGVNAIKTRFLAHQTGIIVGENAGKNDPAPDTSCAALAEGSDRPARALHYTAYTSLLYSQTDEHKQDLTIVPNTGYDAAGMYGSTCGMTLLFGDGDCTPPGLKPASGF